MDKPTLAIQHIEFVGKVAVGIEKAFDEPFIELANDYALPG